MKEGRSSSGKLVVREDAKTLWSSRSRSSPSNTNHQSLTHARGATTFKASDLVLCAAAHTYKHLIFILPPPPSLSPPRRTYHHHHLDSYSTSHDSIICLPNGCETFLYPAWQQQIHKALSRRCSLLWRPCSQTPTEHKRARRIPTWSSSKSLPRPGP